MNEFLEYITQNYTLFLGIAIVILLAIIGSYADRTNFGQGKSKDAIKTRFTKDDLPKNKTISDYLENENIENEKDKVKTDTKLNENIAVNTQIQTNNQNVSQSTINGSSEDLTVPLTNTNSEFTNNSKNIGEFSLDSTLVNGMTPSDIAEQNIKSIETEENKQEDFDKNFEKFDEEFNEVLPKKEIISNDLLADIEDLSLDKTQRIKLSDIPDLDDVELPEIKKLKSVDDDIWKF